MEIIDSITRLDVNILFDHHAANLIGLFIENCRILELRKIFDWIKPALASLLEKKWTGFVVFNLFKTGILIIYSILEFVVIGEKKLRMDLLDEIMKLPVDALTDQSVSETIQNIIQNGDCTTTDLDTLCTWIFPDIQYLLRKKCAGFVILSLFKYGIIK